MSTNDSPYGATRVMLDGTDVPAVEGLRGQGDEPAFNRYATNDGNRQVNASSTADLMKQIGGMMKHARSDQPLSRQSAADTKAKQERTAQFKAAYHSKDPSQMTVLGEVMSEEIWETLGFNGQYFVNSVNPTAIAMGIPS